MVNGTIQFHQICKLYLLTNPMAEKKTYELLKNYL